MKSRESHCQNNVEENQKKKYNDNYKHFGGSFSSQNFVKDALSVQEK